MDAKQMINTVRRLYEEVYSKGNLKLCDELFANNMKLHDPAATNNKSGLASFKEAETTYMRAFPNKKATIDDIIVSENKVIVRWSCQGKQDGEFLGTAPTHRPFKISGISIYLFTGDKISEIWQSWDRLNLFDQLHVTPPAHAMH